MSGVIAAFAEYFVKFVFLVAVAGVGAICGDKIRRSRNGKKK